ncbi:MAG: penicillin-binding protein 2 [Candidatus Cloacimonetes bacterium]|jgi:penicillin-binding protein 2|nr:penicillin-binding protein 2 [Candidatus Cloacimonadota bacterium]MDY0299359.1 penicillin-binding protein 2 [Candidatus Cloacimonadaceae bacterium]MCB5278768.1 penicillin-binding protein 2 [Candidatus Cloacimonadota bacterium]MCK9331718.1 penicillin-binding protein 2 [Candidatus Cloacimonadota bacterium]MDD2210874.1 penicillin-binding protein 2 [Candidatus Cloacimonadota bacterium]
MTKEIKVYSIVSAVLFTLLAASLFRLQVIKGEHYKRVAESNFVRIRRIIATRGEIYDHKYRPIVQNIPAHNLFLTSGKIRNIKTLAQFLNTHFQIEEDELLQMVQQQRFKTYEEILLADNIPYEKVLSVSEDLNYYPELVFRIGSTRNYMFPNHFTGYVGRINQEEYERFQEEDYSINSYIGKTGLERYYEVLLRGKDGREIVQVDAQGHSLGLFKEEGFIEPLNGLSLVLTIDSDLQNFAYRAFPEHLKGAIVVSDVRSGGILAYVSKPGYDPNLFMQRISPEIWADLNNINKPMLDRVIHATYPPGSVFKPITGGFGLNKGIVDRNTKLSFCDGGFQVGNRYFRCWQPSGHGRTNIVEALMHSCDVYFYDLSLKLPLDEFRRFALENHLCTATGIDLPNERNGFFPDTAWYRKTYGQNIGIQGHKVNLSIGQGEILTSPIQMCAFYSAIANNGLWIQPHLLKQTVGRGRLTIEQVQPIHKNRLPLNSEHLKYLQEGLWAVCNAPNGTARSVRVPGATTYGKTGSAENSMGKTTHAWFCGYIVTDKPEIAVTVFMENAGGGGAMAAPVARQIFDFYMGNIEDIKRPVKLPTQFLNAEELELSGDEEQPQPDTNLQTPDAESIPEEQPQP